MVKPYACVACEKVILEQAIEGVPDTGGTASLISLFSKIIAVATPAESTKDSSLEIPVNFVFPKEWAIFSAWDAEAEDAGRDFYICTQIIYPDKTPFQPPAKQRLNIEPNKRAQHVFKLAGFPIGQAGFYTVMTWIEENGESVVGPIEFKIEVEVRKEVRTAQ